MGFRIKPLITLLLFLLLTGCKQTVEMRVDLGNPADFYTNGFPTDLRIQDDGHIDLSLLPGNDHNLTRRYVEEPKARIKGYTTNTPVYLPFTGPLDVALLPKDDTAYLDPGAPIQLIDVDPLSEDYGRRFPLKVSMTWQDDSYRPRHLLQVLPTLGLNLKPDNTYALIVTKRVPVKEHYVLKQNPVLQKLLTQDRIGGEVTYKALHVFAPLRDWLLSSGVDSREVIAATVWTTGNPNRKLFKTGNAIAQFQSPVPDSLK